MSQKGHRPALNRRILGMWETVSWREWWLDSERLAIGLFEMGLRPNNRILILSQTRYEWVVAEIATQMIRTPSVAVFPISSIPNLTFVTQDASPRFALIEDPRQLRKFENITTSIEVFILMDVEASLDAPDEEGRSDIKFDEEMRSKIKGRVILYDDLISLGRKAIAEKRNPISEIRLQTVLSDTACIMYTSGTTGNKRGVVISHQNIISQLDSIEKFRVFEEGQTQLLSLPLAHIFAKVLLWLAVKEGVITAVGNGIRSLIDDALQVNPHVIGLVPSLVDSFEAGLRNDLEKFGSLRLKILDTVWTKTPDFKNLSAFKQRVSTQVGRTSVQVLFGNRIQTFITGGAEVDARSLLFFNRLGIDIRQFYGLTETTGIISVSKNAPHSYAELGDSIDATLGERGEILVRGAVVSDGYFEESQKIPLVDEGGWLHTRDIGEFDERGYLRVRGRLGDTIVTSGGRKIEPRPFELLLEKYEEIERAFLSGHKKPFAVALLQLSSTASAERAADIIAEVNDEIATSATIRSFRILKDSFSREKGELNSSGEFRRNTILRTRSVLLDAMYVRETGFKKRV